MKLVYTIYNTYIVYMYKLGFMVGITTVWRHYKPTQANVKRAPHIVVILQELNMCKMLKKQKVD